MSFFVRFLYAFRAAEKIVSKFVEEGELDDIMLVAGGLGFSISRDKIRGGKSRKMSNVLTGQSAALQAHWHTVIGS